MNCAWDGLLSVLPTGIRREVDSLYRNTLEEVRLRLGQRAEVIAGGKSYCLSSVVTREELIFPVNVASRYSPWAASTAAKGYVTAPGGHRIGLCGDCVVQNGQVTAVRQVTSLCIRVARAFPGIADKAPVSGSLLILGPPGVGKTTLLRELIRIRSEMGSSVAVVDERGELFPLGNIFETGPRTDILTGCSKSQGIEMALRTMSPGCIAVDEITSGEDCTALLTAGWCGVELLATAHAADCADLHRRPVYLPLAESGLFSKALVLSRDKSWRLERMGICT